ncbi:hypothetical protein Bca4012_094647 [Brassica carinata]
MQRRLRFTVRRHRGREDRRRKETAAVELVGAMNCGGHVNPGIPKRRRIETEGTTGLMSWLKFCRKIGADDDDDAHYGESRPEEMTAKRRAEHQCPTYKQL